VGDLLAVPTEITAAHTKGQDLAAYGLDQPCNLVVGDGVEIAEPGEFAVTGVNAVKRDDMQVGIKIESRSPALQEADRTRSRVFDAHCDGLVRVGTMDGLRDKGIDFGGEALIRVAPVTKRNRERHNKLAVGCERQDMVGQVRGRLGHPLGAATWTETTELTTECCNFLLLAHLADKPDKAVGGDAALEVGIELRADIVGERSSLRLAGGDEGAQMLLDDPVAGCELGTASLVGALDCGNGHGAV